MRIVKALEYGATWQTDLNDSVTHIVADKDMTFEFLLKHLGISQLPVSKACLLCQLLVVLTRPDRYHSCQRGLPSSVHRISRLAAAIKDPVQSYRLRDACF